ncbi:MAG: hypothetical protein R2778_07500 [Saprospiraceae bacterium]
MIHVGKQIRLRENLFLHDFAGAHQDAKNTTNTGFVLLIGHFQNRHQSFTVEPGNIYGLIETGTEVTGSGYFEQAPNRFLYGSQAVTNRLASRYIRPFFIGIDCKRDTSQKIGMY